MVQTVKMIRSGDLKSMMAQIDFDSKTETVEEMHPFYTSSKV